MKEFAKRIKHPLTEEEFALRKEDRAIKEAENLVSKMTDALHDHKLYKPATLESHREFKVTSKINMRTPLKTSRKKRADKSQPPLATALSLNKTIAKSTADLKNEAFRALNLIKALEKREQEITIEEANFNQRKSSRATLMYNDMGSETR